MMICVVVKAFILRKIMWRELSLTGCGLKWAEAKPRRSKLGVGWHNHGFRKQKRGVRKLYRKQQAFALGRVEYMLGRGCSAFGVAPQAL